MNFKHQITIATLHKANIINGKNMRLVSLSFNKWGQICLSINMITISPFKRKILFSLHTSAKKKQRHRSAMQRWSRGSTIPLVATTKVSVSCWPVMQPVFFFYLVGNSIRFSHNIATCSIKHSMGMFQVYMHYKDLL